MTELTITDFSDYKGSCDSEEMKRNLTTEWLEQSPLQSRHEDIAHRLTLLKGTENDNPDLARAERTHLMSELATTKIQLNEQKAKLSAAIEKNNPALTKLYNLREAFKNINADEKGEGFKGIDARIELENGDPFLKVSKQMDGGVGFDFTITRDGKLIIPQMSDDKLKELLDFLYRRGITNYELPTGAPKTPEEAQKRVDDKKVENLELDEKTFNKIKQEVIAENENRQDPNFMDAEGHQPSSNKMTAMTEEEYQASRQTAEQNTASAANSNQSSSSASAAPTPQKSNEKNYEDAVKDLTDWGHGVLKKQDGLGMYKDTFSDTFSFYQDNSKNWHKDDGKTDKKDQRHEDGLLFRVRLHKKEGTDKLGGISYYVPKNGKIPDDLAGKLVGLLKSQGMLYIDFPENMPNGDPAVFRKACAQQGLIPMGKVSFNENQARNMIKEAESNLNKSDLLKYKGRMGNYILEQENKKPNPDPDMISYATQLVNEEKFTPLKNFYDAKVISNIRDKSSKAPYPKAEEVMGAALAAQELFRNFDEGKQISSLGIDVNKLDPETKQKWQQLPPDIRVDSLNAEQLDTIYKALEVKCTNDAIETLNAVINSPETKDPAAAVREVVKTTATNLQTLADDFKDKGVDVRFPRTLGNARFSATSTHTASATYAAGNSGYSGR